MYIMQTRLKFENTNKVIPNIPTCKDLKTLIFRQDTPDFLQIISYKSFRNLKSYKNCIKKR